MKTLQDKQNGNIYIIGETNNKKYLYNRVMKFEASRERLDKLKEVKLNKHDLKGLLKDIESYSKYSFKDIIFI